MILSVVLDIDDTALSGEVSSPDFPKTLFGSWRDQVVENLYELRDQKMTSPIDNWWASHELTHLTSTFVREGVEA